MHFRVFSRGQCAEWEYILGVAQFANIIWSITYIHDMSGLNS